METKAKAKNHGAGQLIRSLLSNDRVDVSLPQHDTPSNRIERRVKLQVAQRNMRFKILSEALPIPLVDLKKTTLVAMLANLGAYLKQQTRLRVAIITNQKVWESLSKARARKQPLKSLGAIIQKVNASAEFKRANSANTAMSMLKESKKTQQKSGQTEFDQFDSLAAYNNPYTLYNAPEISGIWTQDKVFASQRLAGLNPMALQRVTTRAEPGVGVPWWVLKKKLSKKINKVALAHLGVNLSLNDAVQADRLYVCDYSAFAGIKQDPNAPGIKQRAFVCPIAVFIKSDRFEGLQLLAIQMGQTPESPAMTAADAQLPGKENNWLYGKMMVQMADVNYNQAVNHLLETHLIEEAFAVSMHRHLAQEHPLNVLLKKHFTALILINHVGETKLLSDAGLIQQILQTGLSGALQLMNEAYQKFEFSQLDFKLGLEARGLDDAEELPYFPYRDDGVLIWDEIGAYCRDYVALYYRTDTDVANDYELQAWAEELSGLAKGFPASIDSKSSVVQILQRLIWTAGPQHAAVNYPQIDFFGFVPNMPTAPYTKIPADFSEAEITDQDLLAFLPPSTKTSAQLEVSFALAGFHHDSLLDYANDLEPRAAKVCEKHFKRLRGQITSTINKRNLQRQKHFGLLPYSYFLPENIPNSTSV